ncbi:hypothetical protein OF83DRAFT_1140202, partial [Amylostereum chailletii]
MGNVLFRSCQDLRESGQSSRPLSRKTSREKHHPPVPLPSLYTVDRASTVRACPRPAYQPGLYL